MKARNLHSGWSFRCLDEADYPRLQLTKPGWMPAQVPGNIHVDLLANRVIGDPFVGKQELGCQWVDHQRWAYQSVFEWIPDPENPIRVLRFEGLDTICKVFLNEELIAQHDNMFLPLEVNISSHLERGRNVLRVEFDSAVETGLARRREYFLAENLDWATNCFDERAFVRKAQYMSGWDWGPRLVSCGIFGTVSLLEYRARIVSASVFQEKLPNGNFRVWADAEVEGDATLSMSLAGKSLGLGENVELAPELWWPALEGSQTLHNADFALNSGHKIWKKFGLRTIRLLREEDSYGRSFTFEVNGRQIFARGANWIPDHSFPSRICAPEVAARIARMPQLGFNMLRVWGGGLYESEEFYDACDEAGILVWQDFPYACMHYPDDQASRDAAYEEASYHLRRLRDRASLALWCGNNENEQMWNGKWGGETNPPRYFGEKIYSETLARAVSDHDPKTDYVRTSPIGLTAENPEISTNPERFGDSHVWTAWHGSGDWRIYADSETRFCSEYGFASSPGMDVWGKILEQNEFDPEHSAVRWHDKTGKGDKFKEYVEMFYPPAQSLEDWVYYSQLNQRDAMRFGVEAFRRSSNCKGSLIWQFNDCWPSQSWALEDHSRLLKPAGHELARAYAQVTLSIFINQDQAEVWAINDSPVGVFRTVEIKILDTMNGDSQVLTELVTLDPATRVLVTSLEIGKMEKQRTAICARVMNWPETQRWEFLAAPKEMMLLEPSVSIRKEDSEIIVNVQGFAADLIVWDEENPANILSPISGWPGWSPITLINSEIRYQCQFAPGKIRIRSLWGEHNV